MRRRQALTWGLLLGLLTACSPSGPAAELEGRTFVSTDVRGHELVDGTQVQITFAGGDLRARAACNTMSGAVSVTDSRLRLPEGLMITEIGCHPPELHDQEEWLGGLLASEPSIDLDGATLMLEHGDVVLTLEELPAPSPP